MFEAENRDQTEKMIEAQAIAQVKHTSHAEDVSQSKAIEESPGIANDNNMGKEGKLTLDIANNENFEKVNTTDENKDGYENNTSDDDQAKKMAKDDNKNQTLNRAKEDVVDNPVNVARVDHRARGGNIVAQDVGRVHAEKLYEGDNMAQSEVTEDSEVMHAMMSTKEDDMDIFNGGDKVKVEDRTKNENKAKVDDKTKDKIMLAKISAKNKILINKLPGQPEEGNLPSSNLTEIVFTDVPKLRIPSQKFPCFIPKSKTKSCKQVGIYVKKIQQNIKICVLG